MRGVCGNAWPQSLEAILPSTSNLTWTCKTDHKRHHARHTDSGFLQQDGMRPDKKTQHGAAHNTLDKWTQPAYNSTQHKTISAMQPNSARHAIHAIGNMQHLAHQKARKATRHSLSQVQNDSHFENWICGEIKFALQLLMLGSAIESQNYGAGNVKSIT